MTAIYNRPRIGTKMREALSEITRQPGIAEEVAERMFTRPTISRLIAAGLVESRGKHLTGRKLYPAFGEPQGDASAPVPGFTLTTPRQRPDLTRTQLNEHNVLAVVCPACKAPGGRLCRSKKNGQEIRFPHYERKDEALYALALLLGLNRSS